MLCCYLICVDIAVPVRCLFYGLRLWCLVCCCLCFWWLVVYCLVLLIVLDDSVSLVCLILIVDCLFGGFGWFCLVIRLVCGVGCLFGCWGGFVVWIKLFIWFMMVFLLGVTDLCYREWCFWMCVTVVYSCDWRVWMVGYCLLCVCFDFALRFIVVFSLSTLGLLFICCFVGCWFNVCVLLLVVIFDGCLFCWVIGLLDSVLSLFGLLVLGTDSGFFDSVVMLGILYF